MATKAQKKSKDSFVWTDDEAELLLCVANEYKVQREMENADWETCQGKYNDILSAFQKQYPYDNGEINALGKDFPHSKEEITKSILTTKLQSVRIKYRAAIDSGRRSGHGRVVLYFELCEQLWGGSPATTALRSGLETTDLEDSTSEATLSSGSSHISSPLPGSPNGEQANKFGSIDIENVEAEEPDNSIAKKRRVLLDEKLKDFKHTRMKRKLPAEKQYSANTQEDIAFKKKLVSMLEETEKEHAQSLQKLSDNIEKLTNSIADGFTLLRQSIYRQHSFAMDPISGGSRPGLPGLEHWSDFHQF